MPAGQTPVPGQTGMRVVVIGGGVVGVTTAWELASRGLHVTLLESQPGFGLGASGDNGAQLSYSYVTPLAQPGLLASLPGLLFGRDAALTLRLRWSMAQWAWCARFAMACTAKRACDTTTALLALARASRVALHELLADQPFDIDHARHGKLVLYRSEGTWRAAQRQVQLQAELGCQQQLLDRAQCVALEPALASSAHGLVGGVYTPDEESGDCRRFVEQLGAHLSARAVVHVGSGDATPVLRQGRLVAVQTPGRRFEADAFVLAAGVGSRAFARQAGIDLPLLGLKGYSTTLALTNAAVAPRVSITDSERRVVYARVDGQLRVAGFVEIGARDATPSPRASRHLHACAAALFPGLIQPQTAPRTWAGLRPATPTGLPIIGSTPIPGLWVNVGHGALGWTLACGSARLLSQRLLGEPGVVDAMPYGFK
ncbi:MAG: D-amino acid dehydrogenase [Variovorax sp.]